MFQVRNQENQCLRIWFPPKIVIYCVLAIFYKPWIYYYDRTRWCVPRGGCTYCRDHWLNRMGDTSTKLSCRFFDFLESLLFFEVKRRSCNDRDVVDYIDGCAVSPLWLFTAHHVGAALKIAGVLAAQWLIPHL